MKPANDPEIEPQMNLGLEMITKSDANDPGPEMVALSEMKWGNELKNLDSGLDL